MLRAGLTLIVVALLPFAAVGANNDGLVCEELETELDKFGYLRALSLDLRGKLPTREEFRALESETDVPAALIDEWLASDAFASRVAYQHRSLLWPSIGNVVLANFQVTLRRTNDAWWRSGNPSLNARGGTNPVGCENLDTTGDGEFDTVTPAVITDGNIGFVLDSEGRRREGYVEVYPYWDPDTLWKICAYDARDNLISPDGVDCSTRDALNVDGCGCGPDLRWCLTTTERANVTELLARDVELRIEDLIREDRPYTELFTGRTGYINGPVAHFFRYTAAFPAGVDLKPVSFPVENYADIPYTDEEMRAVDFGEHHAGVLTSPLFLLRFQTNRARATRFYDAFMCQPFQPPAGGLPDADDACSTDPDLQSRCGCKYCHALLEPAAAHWGRWREGGAGYLDPDAYPRTRPDCMQCAQTGQNCTADCRDNYVVNTTVPAEDDYLGVLNAYYFRNDAHQHYVEEGPELLSLTAVVDNRLPACTARRASEWLLGRPVNDSDTEYLEELVLEFVRSGLSYRDLVKRIITSDVYRRVR